MKIDPNLPVRLIQESVLCEQGRVLLHDGQSTLLADLSGEGSAFRTFCQSVDPNRAFISAFIPDDAEREVFFRAREVALHLGRHMQATVETPERQRSLWESYKAMKRAANAEEGEDEEEDGLDSEEGDEA